MTPDQESAIEQALLAIYSILAEIAPGNIGDLEDISKAIDRLQAARND